MSTSHLNVDLTPLFTLPPSLVSPIFTAVSALFSTSSPSTSKPAFDAALKSILASNPDITESIVTNAAKTAILYLGRLSQLSEPLKPKQHLKEVVAVIPVADEGGVDGGQTIARAKEFVTAVVDATGVIDASAISNLGGSISTSSISGGSGTAIQVNSVVDMSWKFGVTASTDEMKQVGSTFLQLKLYLDKNGVREEELVEMNVEQLYAFLGEMEKAKQFMDLLTMN